MHLKWLLLCSLYKFNRQGYLAMPAGQEIAAAAAANASAVPAAPETAELLPESHDASIGIFHGC
jgi:hypothetical protein